MSLYDQFIAKVHERRGVAARSHRATEKRIAYLKSNLITRLASEMGYWPKSPVNFATYLRERSAKSSDEHRAKFRQVEKMRKRHDELTQLIADQQAIINAVDPLRTAVFIVADALREIGALRVILSSIPEDSLRSSSLDEATTSDAGYRAQELERLKAWRSRLRGEHLRMVSDINALDPKSIDLDATSPSSLGFVGRVLDDLDFITKAIDDATENLKIANGGRPVHEFSITPSSTIGGQTDAIVQV